MKTVRRIYFYLMALVGIQVLIWGIIGQFRILFDSTLVGNLATQVSRSLAWTLVALPIFLLHWLTVQRDAKRDAEERNSRVRALFLYGVLIGLMIPVVQNVLAILSRGLLSLFSEPASAAWIGGNQTLADNLAAILVNLLAFAYFGRILQRDWQSNTPAEAWLETRRLQRYVWMLYGLGLAVVGVIRLLDVLIQLLGPQASSLTTVAVNALALTLIGLPLWIVWWLRIQRSLGQPEEALSLLRLGILFALSIICAIVILVLSATLLNQVLLTILDGRSLDWVTNQSGQIGSWLVFGALWAYLRRTLQQAIHSIPDALRSAATERIYRYLLAAAGCFTVYLGLILVSFEALKRIVHPNWLGSNEPLIGPLAMLLTGLLYWLIFWLRIGQETQRSDEMSEHARRSLARRIYLYGFILISVLSLLGFGGQLVFQLLSQVLGGNTESDLLLNILQMSTGLIIASIWLSYHIQALRRDSGQALRTLQERQANFPVLILHASDEDFANEVRAALNRLAPTLPTAAQDVNLGIPDEALTAAKAIVLPSNLAINPSEALRLWLNDFSGQWVIVPQAHPRQVWSGVELRSLGQTAREAARSVVQLAEGQNVRAAKPNSALVILGYILLGLVGFQILLALLSFFTTTFFD